MNWTDSMNSIALVTRNTYKLAVNEWDRLHDFIVVGTINANLLNSYFKTQICSLLSWEMSSEFPHI